MKKRRAQKAKYQLKIDRACQWVKEKLIQAIHDARTSKFTVPHCEVCGALGSKTNPLCPDHIDGKKWHVRSANQMTRLLRYIAEFQAGVALRILCKKCNERDGAQQRGAGHRVVHHSKVPLPSAPRISRGKVEGLNVEGFPWKVGGSFPTPEQERIMRECENEVEGYP